MIVALVALIAVAAVMAGALVGMAVQAARTDRLLVRMTPDELKALAKRVRARKR
ncbi:MAG: hypothetical protein JWO62_2618 [Acidimicrobiaceae bacterium]|nr:hypothetical protein [Acidimicrobiaceae bacterium]